MTLLGAMVCAEHVLLASDSEAGHPNGFKTSVVKVWSQLVPPVAWGVAGNEVPGLDFVERMKGTDWSTITTWEGLRQSVQRHLYLANESVKGDMRDLQRVFFSDALAHALVVGALEGRLDIVEARPGSQATLVGAHDYAFVGIQELGAKLVVEALRRERGRGFQYGEPLLRMVMEIVATHAQGVATPIRIVRVSADEVVQLE